MKRRSQTSKDDGVSDKFLAPSKSSKSKNSTPRISKSKEEKKKEKADERQDKDKKSRRKEWNMGGACIHAYLAKILGMLLGYTKI